MAELHVKREPMFTLNLSEGEAFRIMQSLYYCANNSTWIPAAKAEADELYSMLSAELERH